MVSQEYICIYIYIQIYTFIHLVFFGKRGGVASLHEGL